MKKFWQENKFVFLLFLIWRTGLFLIGLPGFFLLTFKASFPSIDEMLIGSHFPQWFWQWGNFDGVHYLEIAQKGYYGSGLQVYFPLYPVLIKIGTVLVPNYFLAAFLISNLAFLFAGLVFYHFLKNKYDLPTARWALLFLFGFPTSFFFGSLYTESLFLLLILLAFFTKSWVSAVSSLLAGGTRLIGGFLALALPFARPRNWWGIAGGVGAGLYMIYLYIFYHDLFYFLSGQGAFKNARATSLSTLVTPPQVLFRYLKIFTTASPSHYDFWVAFLEFNAFMFGMAVLLYLTVKRKVPIPWLIFSWLALLLPSFSGTLSSMPRYLLTIFPIFIALAQIKSSKIKIGILTVFTLLLAIFTVLFTRGYFVS